MSKSLETVDAQETANRALCYSLVKNKHKRVLKSRENIFKPKCSRELKKKLKKYKLRKDGIEDPDILDVSKILVKSLRIKSPNNQDKINCNNNTIEQEELNQGNYLIKMVRKKKICTEVKPLVNIIDDTAHNKESDINLLAEEVGDKKHTDAFKLMMKARNKSIGTNSPGKDKIEEQDFKEIAERKEIKAKRNLALQKMAESKGSLKNKEIEKLRDKIIEKKLVERAETFKQMVTKTDSIKNEQKANNACAKQSQPSNEKSNLKTKPERNKFLNLCDIFNETIEIFDHSKQSKLIPTEDIEFQKKLSPSIRKKENMLSYFQKIPKDDPELLENNCIEENNDSIIKVKLNTKCKKKKKKLKLTEKLHTTSETVKNKILTIDDSNESHINDHKRIKRKRNLNVEDEGSPPLQTNNLNSSNIESRPKRNVKKPLKYTDDAQMFSSDEELYIFTPKKKKNSEPSLKSKIVETTEQMVNTIDNITKKNNVGAKDSVLEISKKDESKNKSKLTKTIGLNHTKDANNLSSKSSKYTNDKKAKMKLAPIFVAKMQLSPADIEAKQNFLKSGVPEKLKKKVKKPMNETNFDMFPSVVHIQQSQPDTNSYQEKDWFNGSNYDLIDESYFTQNEYSFKNFLTLEEACNFSVYVSELKPEKVLKSIKCAYPKFPVYRTYHLLRGKSKGEFKDCIYPDLDNSIEIINGQCVDVSNENPDQLNWCDKYKPTSSKQIIGNFESIKELKRWLETWTENVFKAKQIASDSSDFSDFYHSDTDSRDTNRNVNNILILTGQTGSGKTSSVYAVASELAIKVIEVNASSKRTGKIMLQDLQEATQSHKVDRRRNGSDNSQKLKEEIISITIKKRGRPKKINNGKHSTDGKSKQSSLKTSEMSQSQTLASQESIRTGMSLILIDDADIIFEQDDGFCSAIAQLIQSSKRPVILVTSSLSCPHLQRFLQYGKVLHMHPFLSRMLGTWLDVMCLADVGKCYTGLGAKLLDYYRGDIRKTINCLQFYMNSNKHINQGDELALSQIKHNIDDEESSMSWVDSKSLEPSLSNDKEVDSNIDNHLQVLHVGCPLDVFNIWWNLPRLYKHCNKTEIQESEGNSTNMHCITDQDATERLNRLAYVLDTISAIDYFNHKSPGTGTNISTRPWYSSENASLFDSENFECYKKSSLVTAEISDVIIRSTITEAQRVFKCGNSLNFPTPSMSDQRKRDKTVSRHFTLSDYLNSSAVLDRRATALDYWPTCRTICRIEKNRTDSNVKRKNRFCHYLKSLNVPGRNDFFDSLADSLT
ncbi:ATPase family AAA domain-containing protein 5 [Maniola jurtina]|uniref:ATPase family AAA domain-containing protein 5 n=1 Tax=Maniola jurtina TaxID=191418 RepID=UPI001E68C918|nr:ATPase family AAA domain-containing protein 5 [Maniola jurtina]XP_045766224.1 ATPase family AAA domain-containing protein 5 [Maniola jurtina]